MLMSELLSNVQTILHIPTLGTDTRSEILSCYNMALDEQLPHHLDFYKAETQIVVPASLTGTMSLVAGSAGATLDTVWTIAGFDGLIRTDDYDMTATITGTTCVTNLMLEAGLASVAYTLYPIAVDLETATLYTDGSTYDLYNIYGVYVDDTLIGTCTEYDYDTAPLGTADYYNYASPKITFRTPTTNSFTLRLKGYRRPIHADPQTYNASLVVDWPTGWEYYLALIISAKFALINRDDKLYALLTPELAKLQKSFISAQCSLRNNLYAKTSNMYRWGYRTRLDRTLY